MILLKLQKSDARKMQVFYNICTAHACTAATNVTKRTLSVNDCHPVGRCDTSLQSSMIIQPSSVQELDSTMSIAVGMLKHS